MAVVSLAPKLTNMAVADMTVASVPDGADALVVADLARAHGGITLVIARGAAESATLRAMLQFAAPDLAILNMPAWDCIAYDRVSPSPDVSAQRMATLAALGRIREAEESGPWVVVTTAAGALQRTPPVCDVMAASIAARVGEVFDLEELTARLSRAGYARSSLVREPGEFAVRGGILDIFPAGTEAPVRLDFFGDQLDGIRHFDAETQRSTTTIREAQIAPASEILLDEPTIKRFRDGYLRRFGTPQGDPLYEAVSEGHRKAGMEHWLPLFYSRVETLFQVVGSQAQVVIGPLALEAARERWSEIGDHYTARADDAAITAKGTSRLSAGVYRPLEPNALYLSDEDLEAEAKNHLLRRLSPYDAPPSPNTVAFGAKQGRAFIQERQSGEGDLFDQVADHIRHHLDQGRRVVLGGWSGGSAERMAGLLHDHGAPQARAIETLSQLETLPEDKPAYAALPVERGFVTDHLAIISEQDILGDRLSRPRRRKKAADALKDYSALTPGDYVVHIEHGVARYEGLTALTIQDAPHDCLELVYADGDKLYVPVENVDLLTRYGAEEGPGQLDKLGGAAWQARKAKLKQRLRDMADDLIKVAAARKMRDAPVLTPPEGVYGEFCARFAFQETDDQLDAIEATLEDLAAGSPMDRLVCGDVGFGKTEVALRAAFVAAMNGYQVAMVAPTTLLARQHTASFKERFDGFPVKVRQLSRFVSQKEAADTRAGLKSGDVDIVIGTHALLSKSVELKRLGLVIVDEEQRFGVRHKEKLKALKKDVHVLTLTATPIPRTLQMALSGVRELSIIATPPVDRLAVRTYIANFDPVSVREALLREKYRGGQSFFVCPRIADLEEAAEFLSESVPEVSFTTAHGQMGSTDLEERMTHFYDGKADVLLSTPIVESGLDIPTANTLIVHRADRFGLAQLYQLRGRVGRSKVRAYAYLTTPEREPITPQAERRLKALQGLDTLGAGFQLATHDLDIRGGGNLLGEEQSGHVKEVGYELYRQMLEEAVASLQEGAEETEENWSPQVNVGASVLIPEDYVPDLDVRLQLYRRLADTQDKAEVEAFGAELSDRFGSPPEEVRHLMSVVSIKGACRTANIEKVDAGPRGAVIHFRKGGFPDPAALVSWLNTQKTRAKLRPDQTLFIAGSWDDVEARLKGTRAAVEALARLCDDMAEAA